MSFVNLIVRMLRAVRLIRDHILTVRVLSVSFVNLIVRMLRAVRLIRDHILTVRVLSVSL